MGAIILLIAVVITIMVALVGYVGVTMYIWFPFWKSFPMYWPALGLCLVVLFISPYTALCLFIVVAVLMILKGQDRDTKKVGTSVLEFKKGPRVVDKKR